MDQLSNHRRSQAESVAPKATSVMPAPSQTNPNANSPNPPAGSMNSSLRSSPSPAVVNGKLSSPSPPKQPPPPPTAQSLTPSLPSRSARTTPLKVTDVHNFCPDASVADAESFLNSPTSPGPATHNLNDQDEPESEDEELVIQY